MSHCFNEFDVCKGVIKASKIVFMPSIIKFGFRNINRVSLDKYKLLAPANFYSHQEPTKTKFVQEIVLVLEREHKRKTEYIFKDCNLIDVRFFEAT